MKLTQVLALLLIISVVSASWQNLSYQNRFPVNCSGMTANSHIVINGTSGFYINGTKQVVHTNCGNGNLSVYYNNNTDYMVANDTSRICYMVEYGNTTSNCPNRVFANDSDRFAFYPLNEDAASNAIDSLNNTVGTMTGTVNSATGYIDGARGTYSQANYFSMDTTIFNSTNNWTICFWAKATADNPTNQVFWSVPPLGWYHWLSYGTHGSFFSFWAWKAGDTPTSTYWLETAVNNTWYHICGQHTSTGVGLQSISIYGNGVLMNTTAINEGDTDQATPLYIGDLPGAFQSDAFIIDNFDMFQSAAGTNKLPSFINQTYQNGLGTSGFGTLGASESSPGSLTIVFDVFIQPPAPDNASILNCSGDIPDLAAGQYNITWFNNGVDIYEQTGVFTSPIVLSGLLNYTNFTVGDNVSCQITATDGTNVITNYSNTVYINPTFTIYQTVSLPAFTYTTLQNTIAGFFADYEAYILFILCYAFAFLLTRRYPQTLIGAGIGLTTLYFILGNPTLLVGGIISVLVGLLYKQVVG